MFYKDYYVSPLIEHGLPVYGPAERCGYLTGQRRGLVVARRFVETPNRHAEPINDYLIQRRDLKHSVRRIVGVWHTHPDGDTEPSANDLTGLLRATVPLFGVIITTNNMTIFDADGDYHTERVR
jgi:proteasome lid subunit RPN8/RPN11